MRRRNSLNWNARLWGAALAAALACVLAAPVATARAAEASIPLVEEARRKLRAKDFRNANALLEKAIAADPSDPDAHILYQDAAVAAGGMKEVVASYRQKAAEKAEDPVFAYLAARLLPPEQALAEYEKQLATFPKSPWPHVGKARAFEALGKNAEAIAEYEAAVAAAPRETRFKVWQAMGLESAGRLKEALEAWKLVLEAAPKDRAARMGFAEASRRSGANDVAIATLSELVKEDPSDAEALYRIGLAQMDSGRTEDALKSLEAAITADPKFVEALCAAAEATVKRAFEVADKEHRDPTEKDLEKAFGYGKRAVALAPQQPEARFAAGAAYEAGGECNPIYLEYAKTEYDEALKLLALPGKEKLRAFCAKSYVLLRMLKWEEALTTAEKALAIDNKDPVALLHAGIALFAQGDEKRDEAIKKYYRPALKLHPNDARLHHALGVSLWELYQEKEALPELQAAVNLEPDNDRYRLSLGELYFEMKKYKDAASQLEKVMEKRPNDPIAWGIYARVACATKSWTQAVMAYEKVCAILDPAAPAAGGKPGDPAKPGAQPGVQPGAASKPSNQWGIDSIDEHIYLAIIFGEHLKKPDKAKEHVKKYLELGGQDANLQPWIDKILTGK